MMEACPNLELLDFDFSESETSLFQFLEELKGKTAKPETILVSTTSRFSQGIELTRKANGDEIKIEVPEYNDCEPFDLDLLLHQNAVVTSLEIRPWFERFDILPQLAHLEKLKIRIKSDFIVEGECYLPPKSLPNLTLLDLELQQVTDQELSPPENQVKWGSE